MKKLILILFLFLALTPVLSGCSKNTAGAADSGEDKNASDVVPVVTIADNGEHRLTGNIDGQVLVTAEEATLILDGAEINSQDGPAILGDDGNGTDTEQSLTIELRGRNIVTAGVKHGIQAKDNLTITGSGAVEVSAEKDGLHAGNTLDIKGGNVNVVKSFEGLEASIINMAGGTVVTHASDDGLNAASDDDSVTPAVKISGGSLTVYSGSDGIDSNGTLDITGGTVAVFINAPRDGQPMDPNQTGNLLPTLFVTNALKAGTKLSVQDAGGKTIWEGTAEKEATSFSLTVPSLTKGTAYTLTANGTKLASVKATTTVQGMGGGGMGGQNPGEAPEGGGGKRGPWDGAQPPAEGEPPTGAQQTTSL